MNGIQGFAGTWPAIVTPFTNDEAVDIDRLVDLGTWMRDTGSDGLLVLGTVGEGASLDLAERRDVLQALRGADALGDRLLVGVAGTTTEHACRLAEDAASAGAFGLMCLPPVGAHATDDELREHFRAVIEASGLPVMLYNHPEICHNDLSAELIAELAELPGIVSLKECDADSRKVVRVLELTGGELQVSVGGDDTALALFSAGATGWLPGTANVFPEACVSLTRAAIGGDLGALRAMFGALLPIMRLDASDDCASLLKAAMAEVDVEGGTVRAPRRITPEHVDIARTAVLESRARLARLAEAR